jgi:hypothetical protein
VAVVLEVEEEEEYLGVDIHIVSLLLKCFVEAVRYKFV